MKKITLLFSLAFLHFHFTEAQTSTFNFTGSVQTYTVPTCVTSVTITATGAQGANAAVGGTGGLGGYATGVLTVTPGDVLYIYVGGQNGYNGGGVGGVNGNPGFGNAGNGGGASDVRALGTALSNRVIVAGGGGGAGHNGVWPGCQVAGPAGNGGSGGALIGGNGTFGVGTPCNCAGGGGDGGSGGTQSAGGTAGMYAGNTACLRATWGIGQAGSLGIGGSGSLQYHNGTGGGGGGGGGYYGGGSGGNGSDTTPGGGGGGGSSFVGTLISASTNPGTQSGNGQVVISSTPGIPAAPTSISGSTNFCVGSTGIFSISSVPGATSYTWTVPAGSIINSGQGTTSINVTFGATSGNISVTADNACGSSTATNLAVTIGSAPLVGYNLTPGSTVCEGTTVILSGTGATSYTWSGGISDGVPFSALLTSTYTVTGTAGSGCTNTATVTITVNPLPIVTATSTASAVCAGGSVTLTGAGASSYSWTGGVTDGISFVPTISDTYTVTGTDANGCLNTATTSVTVNALPTVTANSTSSAVCAGGSVTLTGAGAANYSWTGGVTDGVPFTPTISDTYTVTGIDVNGCMNSASVAVIVNALPVVGLGPDTTQCGGTITLDAGNAGSSFLWNNTTTNQTISVAASGTYFVDVTDGNGCMGSDTTIVTINTPPTVTGTAASSVVCVDDASVVLTGTPVGGIWSGPGVTGSSFSPATAGVGAQTATYNFTDANGCSGMATANIQVNACVGFTETTLTNSVSVFPNPNSGMFTLSVNSNVGDLTIEILDLQSRIVYSSLEKNVQTGYAKQIALENIANGVYTLRMTTNTEQRTEKIIIQK